MMQSKAMLTGATAGSASKCWQDCIDETLVDDESLEGRLDEIAKEVAETYKDVTRPLVVVSILKGGAHAGVGLTQRLGRLGVPCRIDFLWLASYCGDVSTGRARLLADLQTSVEGERVLLVDDLIDTGLTLATAARPTSRASKASEETGLSRAGSAREDSLTPNTDLTRQSE